MKKLIFFLTYCFLHTTYHCSAQVQWASKVIDFSSEYKDEVIRDNSTRWSASQVLGFPNTTKSVSSQLAWTPKNQDGSKEFITVEFKVPQTVQQVIVGENYNAGAVTEIILYDNSGKKFTVYENEHPTPVQKIYDVLTYFKTKTTYNVVKLKLVLNTNAVFGRQEIDCIGISATTAPYKQNVNVIKYTEQVGQPENLGPNVNSQYYDHLPLISPDGSLLYFTRKLTDENNSKDFNDDIFVAKVMPTGKFTKAENIGPPLNTSSANFICFISNDNNRLYVANKYIRNSYNYAGLSVSAKEKNGDWSKPKALNIPNLYNKNEYAHYHMNLDENIALMSIQRDDSYGDLDLYVAQKYSDGDWSEPRNLGNVINTVGAEGSVFLAADGKTLYFSSSGHPGFGSYDMYMSKRLDDSWTNWSKPLNLGDKINTDEMDIYYTIPASGDYAYFSSGVSYFGKNDLYRIRLPKEARPEYVDINKFVASAPLKKGTTAPPSSVVQPAKNTAPSGLQKPVTSPVNAQQTDDLQKKLDDLKKQQAQITAPVKSLPPATTITTPPAQVKITTTAVNTTTPLTANTEVKKEVLNTIQPYQSPEELRQKPEMINTIKPAETPKPAPRVLTREELTAREQQKNNPTVNPASDGLNNIPRNPIPDPSSLPSPANSRSAQNPNIVTTEVDPNSLSSSREVTPAPVLIAPLKTANPETDELQKKLDALKQQQTEVGQSNKIYANPYEIKPYASQPVKDRQEDKATQDFNDYQKKLDELKQQQKNVTITATNNPVVKEQPLQKTLQTDVNPVVSPIVPVTTEPQPVSQAPNPVISKYEEKLRKLKEEMALLTAPQNTADTKLAAAPSTQISVNTPPVLKQTPVIVYEPVKKEEPKSELIIVGQKDLSPITEKTPAPDIQQPVAVLQPPLNTEADMEAEKNKLDSIQQARRITEQKMTETLDKMGSSKQSLEKDITELQDQRKQIADEKDKLLAQNSQLSGEKEKLESEKKKMDDLLAQMQAERDKLAAEKLKMEQEKAKMDALKKQQERDVLALKRSIDSLGKIQQKTAAGVQSPQNYDLFTVPLKVGAVAQVNNIYFVADASFLQIPSYPELDKVVLFLARNNTLKVEIGGHTNGLCDDYYCQKLSTSRAKTCVDYLISKGISTDRLSYKGYGKTNLLKPEAPGNSLNQRVEIKILSVE